jgi:predicted alpha/beta-hydrolase family hydrolase
VKLRQTLLPERGAQKESRVGSNDNLQTIAAEAVAADMMQPTVRSKLIAFGYPVWVDVIPPTLRAYAVEDLKNRDILGFLCRAESHRCLAVKALGIKQYVLVGHSMGGKVAQLAASRRPEGLSGLILVAPVQPTPRRNPEEMRQGRTASCVRQS